MEIIPTNTTAYGKKCIGCEHHKLDVMLSFLDENGLYEVFLTQEQAKKFRDGLDHVILRNETEP